MENPTFIGVNPYFIYSSSVCNNGKREGTENFTLMSRIVSDIMGLKFDDFNIDIIGVADLN
jgi:hypothetical protein